MLLPGRLNKLQFALRGWADLWGFYSKSAEETYGFGIKLGEAAPTGTVFFLAGPLGAGKTLLAKGIGKGLGIEEMITSPTFTIVQEYKGRVPFYHMDLYRLSGGSEIEEIGLEEYFAAGGVVAVEWPHLFLNLLERNPVLIKIKPDYKKGEDWRKIEVEADAADEIWLKEIVKLYAYTCS